MHRRDFLRAVAMAGAACARGLPFAANAQPAPPEPRRSPAGSPHRR
ncbi:twin-arginine translocation signal domain-containing protein [Burkholderia plantarii]